MIKQRLWKWLSLLLVVIALTACTNRNANITTITLSGWQSSPTDRELFSQILRNFEAEHPQFKVKYEVITDQYMDVIKTRLVGDAAPDVFFLDAFEAPLLMKHGVLEPLDRYITRDFDLADFQPHLLQAFKHDRKLYGIPKDFSTLALFYNQQAFEQANLTKPPQTWKELQAYSSLLTVDLNNDRRSDRYGFGVSPELARQAFIIQAFGGHLVDRQGYANFATAKSLKGLQLIVNQYQGDRTAAQPSDVGASSGSEMFGQGKAAMVIEGPWAIPYFKETFPNIEFSTAEVPSIHGKKGTMAYTVAYVMNKKAKNKEAAWELISYLTDKAGMKAWATGGLVLPSRKSVLAELGYDRNPLYSPFVKGVDYATIWQAGENLPILFTHFNNQFISALLGEQSLQSAMLKAQTAANEEIKAANY